MLTFTPDTRAALLESGWRVLEAPAGITLESLRRDGAPFKGSRYFDRHAAGTREAPVTGGEFAYGPGVMPETLGCTFDDAVARLDRLRAHLPAGTRTGAGPAVLYVWLLTEHHRRTGEWLLAQRFTWAADTHGDSHLVVGAFGRERPIMVNPLPEGTGRGVGLMPLVFPDAANAANAANAAIGHLA